MVKSIISTSSAPAAVGPYSQGIGVVCGDKLLCFFSGQIAIDPKSGKLCGDTAAEQTKQIFYNIGALLKSQNMTFENVVKTTVFLTDISEFAAVNEEYSKCFSVFPPARSCVQVSALPLGALAEIEVVACK